jgi:hypothetical protein
MNFIFYPPQSYKDEHKNWSPWFTVAMWNIRNPFHLFLEHCATDKMPDPTWNPKGGWQFLRHKSGLPFLSYRGTSIECYVGWRPSGLFGLALRHANAKGI